MLFYTNLFLIYSIIGFSFETLLMFILKKSYDSGVLHGPFTICYAIAIFLMILVYIFLNKFEMKKSKEKILFLLIMFAVLTLLEGMSGYLIELIQNKIYWNYDNLKFNIGHYISLEISLVWAFLSFISMYCVFPKTKKYIKKIPKSLTIIISIIFIINLIISTIG